MEDLLLDILARLRDGQALSGKRLAQLIHEHSRRQAAAQAGTPSAAAAGTAAPAARPLAKKRVLPYYLRIKATDPARFASWHVTPELEARLIATLQVKPRRTASGVATVSVITKPFKCAGHCLYCPNDVRMPKSYLASEPACQRAERNAFDPYLQVASRLRALTQMGHNTSKVELIVLGGTWDDYPEPYRLWFASELLRALNDEPPERDAHAQERRRAYRQLGIECRPDQRATQVRETQQAVDKGGLSYDEAITHLYYANPAWQAASARQTATWAAVEAEQQRNEHAAHRCVGLVVETRPDAVSAASLTALRRLGCTKVQMGVQSLDDAVLAANTRTASVAAVRRAFALLRLYGFKIHVHMMLNLLGATPELDVQSYRRLVGSPAFCPDEVKLYPCALVGGTGLVAAYERGAWTPYTEPELLHTLAACTLATPPYARISRMVRDISATSILAGNRKANLRQLVERELAATGAPVHEIRYREIATAPVSVGDLELQTCSYNTNAATEHFLQWVTSASKIAGFLRLSLPRPEALGTHGADALPVRPGEAMIREGHVYGRVAQVGAAGQDAQHLGRGHRLIERACELARTEGYERINVISAIGTREYYRALGFTTHGLYLQKPL
jgi:elongator complex protein 3